MKIHRTSQPPLFRRLSPQYIPSGLGAPAQLRTCDPADVCSL